MTEPQGLDTISDSETRRRYADYRRRIDRARADTIAEFLRREPLTWDGHAELRTDYFVNTVLRRPSGV